MASNCYFESPLGAIRVSSAMILDCCALLIPSSNPNSNKVHAASITTPTNTAATGIERIFGASSITPSPTNTPPIIVPAIKIAWGQVGLSVPPKNWLMYEYIIAVLVWLLADVAVIAQSVFDGVVETYRVNISFDIRNALGQHH
jgi:hypothetical protein